MKKVSIIIVNWNGKHHLEKCLPSLEKITYSNYEVILVDNASSDESVSFVKSKYPSIKIIQNDKNYGFAKGNNIGFKQAHGEYILFLNNDTQVTKDFLDNLVAVLGSDRELGGVQAKVLSMTDPTRLDSVGAFLTNTGFLYHYGYLQKDNKKYDKPIYLYTAKGACMLFRKDVIDQVGLFDDEFFAYFEETDFCHRVWLAGYKIKYVPDAVIYHQIGGTSNSMNNSFIQYHSFKNRINSYIKNLGLSEAIKILPLHIFLCEAAAFVFIIKGKPSIFLAINKAILWNIKKLSQTLKKRKYIQRQIRTVSDNEAFGKLKRFPGLRYYYYLFAKNLRGYEE